MKRTCSLITVISILMLCFYGQSLVYADSASIQQAPEEIKNECIATTVRNEYLYIQELRSCTDEELTSAGYTIEDIQNLRSFSYENALLERASYSYEQLVSMGYTDEQIIVLKNYDGSPLTVDNPVLAATATCTGAIYNTGYDTSRDEFVFNYQFSWNVIPFYEYSDRVSLSWLAVNPNALEISCSATSRTCIIYYFDTVTGEYLYAKYPTLTIMPGFNGYYADYNMTYPDENSSSASWSWAKQGAIYIGLKPDGNAQISLVKAYGAVGHVRLTGAIGIGYQVGSLSWSFSYTPSLTVDTVAISSYTLYRDGTRAAN